MIAAVIALPIAAETPASSPDGFEDDRDLNGSVLSIACADEGDPGTVCSLNARAVVGAPLVCEFSTGMVIRATEKREVVDSLDAREPGRSGEGIGMGIVGEVTLLGEVTMFCGTDVGWG